MTRRDNRQLCSCRMPHILSGCVMQRFFSYGVLEHADFHVWWYTRCLNNCTYRRVRASAGVVLSTQIGNSRMPPSSMISVVNAPKSFFEQFKTKTKLFCKLSIQWQTNVGDSLAILTPKHWQATRHVSVSISISMLSLITRWAVLVEGKKVWWTWKSICSTPILLPWRALHRVPESPWTLALSTSETYNHYLAQKTTQAASNSSVTLWFSRSTAILFCCCDSTGRNVLILKN